MVFICHQLAVAGSSDVQPKVVGHNGAFRYDATLFSRDKRPLLPLLLLLLPLLRRERHFFHITAIDDSSQ